MKPKTASAATTMAIRQPIITVAGHVDHGKTSLLDAFRASNVQEGEAGGITQKISFTRFPLEKIHAMCPLLKEKQLDLKLPGFLFIDTPGHAAFTNLRKRGGSLADLAIVVVDIREGIQPQTAEVLSILKTHKTPFVVALNKIDSLSGWKRHDSLQESVERQTSNVQEAFNTLLLTFQGSLQAHGFNAELYHEIRDFTKQVAIVPCSARTGEGIAELLFVLCGLSQKFLTKQLALGQDAKGVILEIKKERAAEHVEAIVYDGTLHEGDEIAIASLGEPVVAKVRALEEIQPLSFKYKTVTSATAATGVRLKLADKEGLLPGMPFQTLNKNLDDLKALFKEEVRDVVQTDTQGIVAKADSLGSLEALLTLLRQARIQVVKAGIGPIGKTDVSAAKASAEQNVLDGIIVGFNVQAEDGLELGNVPVFTHEVVYRLIDDVMKWRERKHAELEKERLMGLATICKLELLPRFVFRNSNPAVFGVRVLAGTLKAHVPLIDEDDEAVGHVKAIQADKQNMSESPAGSEVAISLPGVNYERRLKEKRYLYAQVSERQFKAFKQNKDLLSREELQTLQEIADIKRRKNAGGGRETSEKNAQRGRNRDK